MGIPDKSVLAACLQQPAAVRAAAAALGAAGGRAWIVGGAVRDAAFGAGATDWDLATTLAPGPLAAALPAARALDRRLGVFALPADGHQVTVSSLREEGGYRDRRHPDEVRFVADVERDAPRRDFTINAVYVDAVTGGVEDPCDGLADAALGVLRAIGDPVGRLREDPLRWLRAVRFAGAWRLRVDAATERALRDGAGLLLHLSAERVRDELTRAFTGRGRAHALRLLVDWGGAAAVLPEVAAMAGVEQPRRFHPEGCVLTHTCRVLANVMPGDPVQAWSAVLHDIGKPPTFERAADRIRFSGHDVLSARMAAAVLRRLRAPRELIDAVTEICRDHIRFASLPRMGRAKRERWLRSPLFAAHLGFHRADCLGSHGDLSIHAAARRMLAELPPEPPPPQCTGRDVLALGVEPGPAVGEILRELEDRLDAEAAPDRARALELLAGIVAARDGRGPRSV